METYQCYFAILPPPTSLYANISLFQHAYQHAIPTCYINIPPTQHRLSMCLCMAPLSTWPRAGIVCKSSPTSACLLATPMQASCDDVCVVFSCYCNIYISQLFGMIFGLCHMYGSLGSCCCILLLHVAYGPCHHPFFSYVFIFFTHPNIAPPQKHTVVTTHTFEYISNWYVRCSL